MEILLLIIGFLFGMIFLFSSAVFIAKRQASKWVTDRVEGAVTPEKMDALKKNLDKQYAIALMKINQEKEEEIKKIRKETEEKLEKLRGMV
jgi:biopolymer transport protein ExbB/TolQ